MNVDWSLLLIAFLLGMLAAFGLAHWLDSQEEE